MSEQNRKRRQEIRSLERRKAEVMAGVVTDDDPLTISVRGGAPVPATAVGASPAVDDAVLVVASGSRYFVLGGTIGGGGGGGVTLTTLGVSAYGKTLVDDTDAPAARSTLGLTTYRNIQQVTGGATGLGSVSTTKTIFGADGVLMMTGAAYARAPVIVYLDDADYLETGGTLKLRLRAQLLCNATAPAITVTFGLYPITAAAGGSGVLSETIGTVVSGSTVAFTTPSASSQNQGNSGDFTVPADGYYAIGVVGSGTQAANSYLGMTAQLQVRTV